MQEEYAQLAADIKIDSEKHEDKGLTNSDTCQPIDRAR